MTSPLEAGALTIFGITGDLSSRKLMPALYHLLEDGLMPDNFVIIGLSRRPASVPDLMTGLRRTLEEQQHPVEPDILDRLGTMISLMQIDMQSPDGFNALKSHLEKVEEEMNVCLNRLFYLAIPAAAFGTIIDALGEAGLNTGCQHDASQSRLLLEKPFGSDLASAQALIQRLGKSFAADQVYRIDHYLAKETAQNILTFRFQNPLFRACWDERLIESITLTAAETLGIENRANFYDQTGALRDLVQSHLLQLLALVTIDEPAHPTAESTHVEKAKVLDLIRPLSPEQVATQVVRGQYEGYLEDVGKSASTTETFVALRLNIANERWHDVPMILRTGKAMAVKTTNITIAFRQSAHPQTPANTLTINIQPDEGIELKLVAKTPGFADQTQVVEMDFRYNRSFTGQHLPDAYERVLADAFRGDQSLFATDAEELATWTFIQSILDAWSQSGDLPTIYPKGSWGPAASETLLQP